MRDHVSVTEDYLVQLLDTDPVGGTELKQIIRVESLGFRVDVLRGRCRREAVGQD